MQHDIYYNDADTVISDVIGKKGESSKDPLNSSANDHPQLRISRRARKPHVPLNISRTEKKRTLAMHIRIYGSAHHIEY
jgi:hypothetical protein